MLAAAAALTLGACLHRGARAYRCERPHDRPAAPRPPAGPTHADYARLLPLRSYVRVDSVGEDLHHFRVWYGCRAWNGYIEPNYVDLEVTPDGRAIRETHGTWGDRALPPQHAPGAVPPELRSLADRARAYVQHQNPDARIAALAYGGYYREVHLVEYLPYDAPHEGRRVGMENHLLFGASPDLTRVVHPALSFSGGGLERLCFRDAACALAPRWLRFEPTEAPWLRTRLYPGANDEPPQGVLDRALALIREQRTVPLDALPESAQTGLLPADLRVPVTVWIMLYGEFAVPSSARAVGHVDVPLDTRALARGPAEGTASTTLLGRTFRVSARLSAPTLATLEGPSLEDLPLELSVRIDDGRGTVRELHLPASGPLVRDQGRVAFAAFWLADSGARPQARHAAFPAPQGYAAIDAYVDFRAFFHPRAQ